MTITLGDIDTGTHPHGSIKAGPYDYARVTQRWFGVNGEYTLAGGISGRELSCWLILTGYSSHAELHAGLANLNGLANTSGTMDVDGLEFLNVIFNGFEPEEDPWYDGSGVNGWQVKGMMKFRQAVST